MDNRHHVDSPSLDRRIQLPRNIRRTQDQHPRLIIPDTIHLDEEFRLDASGSFGFTLASRASEGVDLVDEDDGGLGFTGHLEELLNESEGTKTQTKEVGRGPEE